MVQLTRLWILVIQLGVAATLMLWCCADPARAEDHSVMASSVQHTLELQGDDNVSVLGSQNQLTLRGSGAGLSVLGSFNQVRVEGVLKSISVMGASNTVVIVLPKGQPRPSYSDLGQNNVIRYEEMK